MITAADLITARINVAKRRDLQGLILTVCVSNTTDEYVVTLEDPKSLLCSQIYLPGQLGRMGVCAFDKAVDEAASKALEAMRAFITPAALSPECPCGIHRSRCEYHGSAK